LTNGPLEIVAAVLITLVVILPWREIEADWGKEEF